MIELLAVIVVLAIIALIAVPIVLNIIEQARKGAAVSSARSYIKAIEAYVLLSELDENKEILKNNNKYNVTVPTTIEEKIYEAINNLIEIKGNKPVGIDDYIVLGESYSVVEAKLTINSYEILIKNDEIISITKSGKTENLDNESIILNPISEDVEVGSTLKLTATIIGNNDKTVKWTSSDESIATVDSTGLVMGIRAGEVKITATTNSGNVASASITVYQVSLLSEKVKIGDYVAYDAGTWTSSASLPTSQGEFGGYTIGQNKANSVTERCNLLYNEIPMYKGWRVLKIENSQVYLVHAGYPECYYHAEGKNNESVTDLNNRATNEYLNSRYAESAHNMTYEEAYTITGNLDSTTNIIRKIGASYWLATAHNDNYLLRVCSEGSIGGDRNYSIGIRPVIVLKPNIKTTGKTNDKVGQVAWNLMVP